MDPAQPFDVIGGRMRVFLRVLPKASQNQLKGTRTDASGQARLLVTVTAVAEGGKANAAVIKLLARTWRVPKTSLHIVTGVTARNKVIEIDAGDDPAVLVNKLGFGGLST